MQIEKLSNTCSAFHLYDLPKSDIRNSDFSYNLKTVIKDFCRKESIRLDGSMLFDNNKKVLVYFSNYSIFTKERWILMVNGFRKKGCYIGYKKNKVYIMVKKLN